MKIDLVPIAGTSIQLIDGDRGKNYPSKKDFSTSGDCLFLDSSNLTKNGFDFATKVFISSAKDAAMNNGKLLPNDIVMNTRGTIGNVALYENSIPFKSIRINSGMLLIRGGADYDQEFLYSYFRSSIFTEQVQNMVSGSVQSQLPIWIFNSIKIPKISISEQRKIAKVIRTLDKKIEIIRKSIEDLQDYLNILYNFWILQFEFPRSGTNAPLSQGGKLRFDSHLIREVPENWEVSKISKYVQIASGYTFKSENYVESGKYGIVTIRNVQDGKLDLQHMNRTLTIPSNIPEHCILNHGDFLISLTGNVGRVAIVNENDLLLNQRVGKFVGPEKYLKYVYLHFSQKENKERLISLANGSAQSNLSSIDATNDYICWPDEGTLDRFNILVNPVLEKLIALSKEESFIATQREEIVSLLINGKVQLR